MAMLAAAPQPTAAELSNTGNGAYGSASLWVAGNGAASPSAPTAADAVTITRGEVSIGQGGQAGTFNLTGGVLTAGDVGAQLEAGDVYQTGGTMTGTVITNNYDISGGTVAGGVWLPDDHDYWTYEGEFFNSANKVSISIAEQMTISGTAVIDKDVWIIAHGDAPATITQDGAASVMNGAVSYLWAWPGVTAYYLKDGLVGADAHIMPGDLFAQTGGTMNGYADTWIYELWHGSVGGIASAVDFYLSGDGQVVAGGEVAFFHDMTIDGGVIDSGGKVTAQPQGPGNGQVMQTAGAVDGTVVAVTYQMSGGAIGGTASIDISDRFTLSGDATIASGATIKKGDPRLNLVNVPDEDDGSIASPINTFAQSGGTMGGDVTTDVYSQSGGAMDGAVTTGTFVQSGGQLSGTVTAGTYQLTTASGTSSGATIAASSAFALAPTTGTASVAAKLTGTGKLTKSGAGTVVLTNAENDFSGGIAINAGRLQAINDALPDTAAVTIASTATLQMSINTGVATTFGGTATGTGSLVKDGGGTLNLTGRVNVGRLGIEAGTVHATNNALVGTGAVNMAADTVLQMTVDSGNTAIYGGSMTGVEAKLVKDGAGTLTLSGTISLAEIGIEAGTLQATNSALANTGTISIAESATLQMTVASGNTAIFNGGMTGGVGTLLKDGAGTLTLGGVIRLGALYVDAGWLNIGSGAAGSAADVSFESALIKSGATVYVAEGATLTIRVPNNLVNFGTLINDGTVHDDLDNNAAFDNNHVFNANVTANTGTINNNTPGAWTGDILTNASVISNNSGASWLGAIKTNGGTVINAFGGTWAGAVDGNTGFVANRGNWTGNVNSNGSSGYPASFMMISNEKNAIWTGDVVENRASIRNFAGTWNGNILNNYTDIMNDNSANELDLGRWNGNVVGNNGLIFNGGGGIWTGDVLSNAGRIVSDRAAHHTVPTDLAEWHGDVLGNTGSIESHASWFGDVRANAGGISNSGWWQGDIYSGNTGTVSNAQTAYRGPEYDTIRPTWAGKVTGNFGTIRNISADWTGDVVANSGNILNTGGIYNGIQIEHSTWMGDVQSNAGTITNAAGSTWTGDVLINAGTIQTAGVWNGTFSNSAGGTVRAQGQINGSVSNAGTLYVTGALTGISTLTNSGALDLRRGGSAGQTLTVTTANLQANSTLAVSLDTAGNADRLVATTATLGGMVTVTLNPIIGNADYTKTYSILEATRTGAFAGVTTDLAFLDPQLNYGTPGSVKLTLVQNQQSFDSIAVTPNQRHTAAAVQALGSGNPVYGAILGLTSAQAKEAFDQLAGASQASTQIANLQGASLVTQVLAGRINQSFDALGGGGSSASSYAETPTIVANLSPTSGIWGQFFGAYGSVVTTPSMAGMNSTTGGFAAGLDGELGPWRVGAVFDTGSTVTALPELNASSSSVDYGAGIYGGGEFGSTRLSLGVHYARHAISSSRHVIFPGFDETLTANYAAGTAQAFVQVAQEFEFGATSVTPYMGLQYAANATDGHAETGGASALTSAANLVEATFTTLGLTASHKFVVGGDMLLTANGGLGWRHGFVGTPTLVQSFAGGSSFTVLGASLPADTALLNAGLNLDVSATTTLNLTYDGQFSIGAQTHGLALAWNSKF